MLCTAAQHSNSIIKVSHTDDMEAEQHDGQDKVDRTKLTRQQQGNDIDKGTNKACMMLPVASAENP